MNGRHNDESNSSHFSTDFLQQSNEEEGNRELLPFTQHFSLCQEFLKCHKNNSHASWIVNNFLWTFHYVSSSTQTPCNPSKTANSQRTLCPATQMPRGMEERTPCSTRPQRREKQMLLGGGALWTHCSSAKTWGNRKPSRRVSAMRSSHRWSSHQHGWLQRGKDTLKPCSANHLQAMKRITSLDGQNLMHFLRHENNNYH